MRLVIVAGIALYVLTSLYESRNNERCRVDCPSPASRRRPRRARRGRHAHTGDHGGMFNGMHRPRAHRARRSVGTGHASDDASDADPASNAFRRARRAPVLPRRRGSASVPAGWMDAAPRSSAKKNARKDAAAAARTRTTAGGHCFPRAAGALCRRRGSSPACARAPLLPARGDDRPAGGVRRRKDVQRAIETAKAAVGPARGPCWWRRATRRRRRRPPPRALPYARARARHALRPAPVRVGVGDPLGADVLLVGRATMHGPNPLVNLPPRRGADAEGVPASLARWGR